MVDLTNDDMNIARKTWFWAALVGMLPMLTGAGTTTLADGWTFRLEDESEMRPVCVPHDWGVEKGFLPPGAWPAQGDLPFVGKGLYRRKFDGFVPPEGGRTYLTLDGVQCITLIRTCGASDIPPDGGVICFRFAQT